MKKLIVSLGVLGTVLTSPVIAQDYSESYYSTTNENYDSVATFCRDRLQVLRNAYRRAELESQLGNHTKSSTILEKGLRDAALKIRPAYQATLTSKAISRGITLVNKLKATEESKQKVRTINNFLFNYYLFIEKVSERLDIPYYQSGRGYSMYNSNIQFEKAFVNFAQEQVQMVLKTMTSTDGNGRQGIIYPIGSPNLLLTALQITTRFMAQDLSESVFATRYACTIEGLTQVSADISDYLKYKNTYADEYIAIQDLVGRAKGILGNNSRYCSDYSESSQTQTSDVLRGSITLYSGTTKQVRLNESRYIKKLIISSEGVRNDAIFDVVVNGDVKGTIYVPGRDPSYFVTVEDYADSIEFVSRGGTAIISKILVVAQ